jgi:hypothetical protein
MHAEQAPVDEKYFHICPMNYNKYMDFVKPLE